MPQTTSTIPAVIDLRDATTEPAVTVELRLLRRVRLAAVVALTVLNVLDLITTRMFLDRGLEEGNALADVMLNTGTMPYVKAIILFGLAWTALRSVPKLGTTCAMWCVVGVYAAVVGVNSLALASL